MDAAVATEGKFFWLISWRGRKVQITALDLPVCSVFAQRALPAGGGQALGDEYFFTVI